MGSADMPTANAIARPAASALHSRFVQRIRRRYADELALLPPGVPSRDRIDALIDTLLTGGRPLGSALRVARQLVIERLAVLDVEHCTPMAVLVLIKIDDGLFHSLAQVPCAGPPRRGRLPPQKYRQRDHPADGGGCDQRNELPIFARKCRLDSRGENPKLGNVDHY